MGRVIKKIGMSSNPAVKMLAAVLRKPVMFALYRLLKHRKDKQIIDLIRNVQREKQFMMWPDELVLLYDSARRASNLNGDFAEAGVYQGASAKVICEAKGNKAFHLFDTFEGLPAAEEIFIGGGWLYREQYAAALETVKKYLEKYENLFFYKGVFPDAAQAVSQKTFVFVHLDLDLSKSICGGLEFFYPRMVQGGVILVHDYSILPGIQKCVSNFFSGKPDLVIELPTSQCLIIKA